MTQFDTILARIPTHDGKQTISEHRRLNMALHEWQLISFGPTRRSTFSLDGMGN